MRILIVTGEASGDLHGAHLAKAIMALDSTAELVGIGIQCRVPEVVIPHSVPLIRSTLADLVKDSAPTPVLCRE